MFLHMNLQSNPPTAHSGFSTTPLAIGDKIVKGSLPNLSDEEDDDYNIFNSKSWQWTPKKGMLIFFPSSVYHRILRNESSKTRYSIAFNFMPLGVIGDGDSQFIYK